MEKRIALKDIIVDNGAIIPKGTVVDCEVKSCVYGDNREGFKATIFMGDQELCSIILKNENVLAKVYFVEDISVSGYMRLFRLIYTDFKRFLQCKALRVSVNFEDVELDIR